MRALTAADAMLDPRELLAMTTVNPARALGRQGQLGELAAGALADLIALPFAGDVSHVVEAVTQHQGHVAAAMIDGSWSWLAPGFGGVATANQIDPVKS
jgi:imidazolonepropionase-like amidohydrolase